MKESLKNPSCNTYPDPLETNYFVYDLAISEEGKPLCYKLNNTLVICLD